MAREVRRSKDEVFEAVQRAYKNFERRITPIYPWTLVRVLPKEQKHGALWIPESQNKVLYEGVVLEIWPEFDKPIRVDGEDMTVHMKSQLERGDHVLFAHFEGMPVPYLNAEEKDAYRLVREGNLYDYGCAIYGKVEYQAESIEDQVADWLSEQRIPGKDGRLCASVLHNDVRTIVRGLLKEFYVVRKTAEPKTTSGYNGPR